MKELILGITGSIAAYKAADLANELTKKGTRVSCVMTAGGRRFLTPLTLQTLSKCRVYTDVFDESCPGEVSHIALATRAVGALIAPASADFLAKAACGIADDMLTATLLALWDKPVVVCPAMNTNMYENPLTQRNIRTLRELGWHIVEPRESLLACGQVGKGALADLPTILQTAESVFSLSD